MKNDKRKQYWGDKRIVTRVLELFSDHLEPRKDNYGKK